MEYSREDLANSVLLTVVSDIARMAYLVARTQDVATAVFCGSFISNHDTVRTLMDENFKFCGSFLKVSEWFCQ